MMILPIIIKSRNVLDRQHWAKKSMLKKEYALLIRNQMRLNKHTFAEQQKYEITIKSNRKKLLDYDNLVGGCKHLIDALIEEKFIFDDSPEYIFMKFEQRANRGNTTEIYRRKI